MENLSTISDTESTPNLLTKRDASGNIKANTFTSTSSTSSPFNISSTSKVINLNAEYISDTKIKNSSLANQLLLGDIKEASWTKVSGDISLNSGQFTVNKINGISLSNTPSNNQLLSFDGSNAIWKSLPDNIVYTNSNTGLIDTNLLPAIAIINTYVISNPLSTKSSILIDPATTNVQTGDICIINAEAKTYILTSDYVITDTDEQKLNKWIALLSPTGGVLSINGSVGQTVSLNYSNIDTYSDNILTAGNYNTVSLNNKGRIIGASKTSYIPSSRLPELDNGTAKLSTLDSNNKIPLEYLPTPNVLEFNDFLAFPQNPESNKIFIDKSNNSTYRYDGSHYIKLSSSNILDSSRSISISKNLLLTIDSKKIQNIIATNPKLVIIAPDATKLPIGINYIIKNDGQLSFEIADMLGNWIAEVKPNATVALLLSDNLHNIFNYTENNIQKTGISGHWIPLIGEQSTKSRLMMHNPTRLNSSKITNIKSSPIDDNLILTSYVSNGKLFASIIDNQNIINTLEIDYSTNIVDVSKYKNYFVISYKNINGLHAIKLYIDANTILKNIPIVLSVDDVKYVKNIKNIIGYISSSNHLNILVLNDDLSIQKYSDYGIIGDNFDMTSVNDKLLIVYNLNGLKSIMVNLSSSISYSPVYEINQNNCDFIQLFYNGKNTICSYYDKSGYVKIVVLSSSGYIISNIPTDVIFIGDDVKISGALISSLSSIGYNSNIICSYANTNGFIEIADISINEMMIKINHIHKIKNNASMVNMVYLPSKPSVLFDGNNGYLNIL